MVKEANLILRVLGVSPKKRVLRVVRENAGL